MKNRFITLLILCGQAAALRAATTTVNFQNFAFSPKVVQVNAGDTVMFVNGGGTHTVTGSGSDSICGNGVVSTSCSHTFSTPGNYPYMCLFHGSEFNMTGMVVVVTAPPPPPPSAPGLTNFALAGSVFRFTANVTANHTNLVQASADLSSTNNWITIGSNAGAATSFSFTDSAGVFPLRYYRVVAH